MCFHKHALHNPNPVCLSQTASKKEMRAFRAEPAGCMSCGQTNWSGARWEADHSLLAPLRHFPICGGAPGFLSCLHSPFHAPPGLLPWNATSLLKYQHLSPCQRLPGQSGSWVCTSGSSQRTDTGYIIAREGDQSGDRVYTPLSSSSRGLALISPIISDLSLS